LKADVSQKNPHTIEELIYYIYAGWKNLKQSAVSTIFSSIYKRVELLIEGRGDPLKY
jgi:hypothetical protein